MKYDIKSLTLDEKLHLLTGADRWRLTTANGKLPEVFLSDGPHGLRMMDDDGSTRPATSMPTLSVVASTWDTEMARLQGSTIADDCIENGADVLLAPGVNIKRTPLCGRNFEYFSEDPYLSGHMGKAFIEGVQKKGIGTSLKHFFANNREEERFGQTSELDERTAREIYLTPFETALEADPWTVMCAYNPINGIWASENKWALTDLLRGDFGYKGMVVSDWGAVHSGWRCVKAGLDLRMPYKDVAYDELKNAMERGALTEKEVDACVTRLLEFIEKCQNGMKKIEFSKEERHQNATRIASEGAVLLKNEDNVLPLKGGRIALSGFLDQVPLGGGGSSLVNPERQPRSLTVELSDRLPAAEVVGISCASLRHDSELNYVPDCARIAYGADAAVVCVGRTPIVEREAFDLQSIRLSDAQERLILEVARKNPNTVVVLYTGSAVDVSPWADKVKGILWAGYMGEGVNEAVADLLSGKVCPSGKLTETWPYHLEDTPTGDCREIGSFTDRYTEGVLVGYRWYDTKGKDVAYPFGHGLSYTSFEYSDLQIEKHSEVDYTVSFTVKNTGALVGKEVAQLYVCDPFCRVTRPEKELKGFAKVELAPDEEKRVVLKLDKRSFAYYNTCLSEWYVENGDFEILVGKSSRDLPLKGRIKVSLPSDEQYSVWHYGNDNM